MHHRPAYLSDKLLGPGIHKTDSYVGNRPQIVLVTPIWPDYDVLFAMTQGLLEAKMHARCEGSWHILQNALSAELGVD